MHQQPLYFYFDYVDPASYLLDLSLRETEPRAMWELVHRPFELRPPPEPMIDPDDGDWAASTAQIMAEAERRGVDIRPPRLISWTRKAHELALFGEESGCFREVHAAIFRAHMIEGRDIGRVDVLVELASEVGLDPEQARITLGVDRLLHRILEMRVQAEDLGVRMAPTLILGDRRIGGYGDKEGLRAFLGANE